MNKLIVTLLPLLLLLILYIFIFTRRGEVQRAKVSLNGYDWMTFFAIILGTNVLLPAMKASGMNAPQWLPITVSLMILLFLLVVILRKSGTGKPIIQRLGDERVNLIYAKSARNALFATYLIFFVHLLTTNANTIDTMWVVFTLAGGLLVLIASTFFYYYRES